MDMHDPAGESLAPSAPPAPAIIDADHLAHQRTWSAETFGPGPRTLGILDHLRKELDEIEADPTDLGEWVDVLILAFDGAWRAGWEPQQIIDAVKAKQARNEARTWGDWRTLGDDVAIEHDRSEEVPPALAWLAQGVDAGYCTPVVCATHEGVPDLGDEAAQWDDGGDPCQHVVRLLDSEPTP